MSMSDYAKGKKLTRQAIKARLDKAIKKMKAHAEKNKLKIEDF